MKAKTPLKSYFSDARAAFVLFGVVVVGVLLFSEFATDRLNLYDFQVMYGAAEAYLSDEAVYGVPFGLKTGFYKYSPFTMLAFTVYTLFTFKTAGVIHFLLIGACAIGSILRLEQLFRQYCPPVRKRTFWLLLAVFLSVFVHFFRDIHLGNINIVLVFLLTVALQLAIRDRSKSAGLILAFVIMAKPYFLVCGLPFLAFGRWKVILSTVVWVSFFIGVTVLVIGWSESLRLHQEWFTAMMDHSSYLRSSHTLFSLCATYLGVNVPSRYAFYLFPVMALLLIYLIDRMTKRLVKIGVDEGEVKLQGLLMLFFLLMALIPGIFITDTEHFLFSLPLIVHCCFQRRHTSWWWVVLLVMILVLYGGNSSDLLGKDLSVKVDQWGLLGISNVMLIGLSLRWFVHIENVTLKREAIKPR